MTPRFRNQTARVAILALPLLALLTLSGCSERNPAELEQAVGVDNPNVFSDEFLDGLDYAAFEFSNYDAFIIDETESYEGTASLKYAIPAGDWAGGSFYSNIPRDLRRYNALTFWAKASRDVDVGAMGFGLGIDYPSDYKGEIYNVSLTTDWTRIIIPVPNSDRMTQERGLFWLSAAAGEAAVDLWFDEVVFTNESVITYPRPIMSEGAVQALVGEEFVIPGTRTTFSVNGEDLLVYHTQNHFDYFSSDGAVAAANENIITAVSLGEATITAKLRSTDVQGEATAKVVNKITQPNVFIDAVDPGLEYGAFEFSYYEALSIDETNGVNGSAALKYTIPLGNWAGGAFFSPEPRDLSSFDALVLDAKAGGAYTLEAIGYGIGMSAGGTDYMVEINDVQLTADWTQIVIPLPDPARLAAENGVFWFSTGNAGEVWFDNIQFANLESGIVTNPRPVMDSANVDALLGETVTIEGTETTYSVDLMDLEVSHTSGYFTYFSSDESVVTTQNGVVTAVGGGSATVTAKLRDTDVDGEVTVSVIAPPATAAPTPIHDQADVISIFSDAYTDITVDTWRADWTFGAIEVFDQQIEGDNVKAYTGFSNPSLYCGIEFTSNTIDATTAGMTHFHMDVFAPVGTQVGYKLVDFGADGVWGTDDTEYQLEFNAGTTPPFAAGQWVSLDIPLTEFVGMNFGSVAQLVLTRINTGSVWVDNIYFHK